MPAIRVVRPVSQQEPQRPAGGSRQRAHPFEFGGLVIEIAEHPECARAGAAEGGTDAEEFPVLGEAARDQVALCGLVLFSPRGRETEGACAQGFFRQAAHGLDVGGSGDLAADGAVAHDIDAQRVVRHLSGDVDGTREAVQRVEIVGECLPLPAQAF